MVIEMEIWKWRWRWEFGDGDGDVEMDIDGVLGIGMEKEILRWGLGC